MTRDTIKTIIAESQRMAQSIELISRPYEFEDSLNYVLVGLRRAGKSYLMYQRIQALIKQGHSPDEILYFNFEDDRLDTVTVHDLDFIKSCFEEMYPCRPIFFLDEIQNVEGWEKFARRIADQKYRVYITGSNARMLSSEISSTLGGRYVVKEVFPFTFKECLLSRGIIISDKNTQYSRYAEILRYLEEYFRFGGLPEILQIEDKRSWLSSLYNKIFLGDVVARYGVRNDFALRILVRKLAESVKQPTSYTRLTNIVSSTGKKISKDSVIEYVEHLIESWIIFPVENLAAALADKVSNRKYYFIDNGILNLFLTDPKSSLMENIVAIQLRRVYGDRVYFYSASKKIDFIIPEAGVAIQVCYSLNNDIETISREISPFEGISSAFGIEKCIIVTRDEENVIENEKVPGGKINVRPLYKWLLEIDS